jgi:hypothetical protein
MILCPKCGKVKEYGIKEYIHRVGIFNENNECVETTEDVGFRYGQPRCLKCGRLVKFYIDPQESEDNE